MSDQIIIQTSNDSTSSTIVPSLNRKIRPLKHKFFTFLSAYDYGEDYYPLVNKILIKNPKWCNLSLKLGHTGEYLKLQRLHRAKSLRLRSIHLESYQLDSQACGDSINRYFGELDALTRAGQTLKKLSLSVIYSHHQPTYFLVREHKPDTYHHLKKFVKKQKHLDEFGLYMGRRGNSKWMCNLLKYVEKTVKTLTIQNMAIERIFKKYKFPKLETLRFEYIQFHATEDTFDFSLLRKSLHDFLALPSLKTLVFSQYQRYGLSFLDPWDEEAEPFPKEQVELLSEFWEELRAELDKNKDKPLKIKYHKKDDENVPEKVENFKRIFKELPINQTFEYEIVRASTLSFEELEAQGLKVDDWGWEYRNFNHYWKGSRYLISLDKVEPL